MAEHVPGGEMPKTYTGTQPLPKMVRVSAINHDTGSSHVIEVCDGKVHIELTIGCAALGAHAHPRRMWIDAIDLVKAINATGYGLEEVNKLKAENADLQRRLDENVRSE